MNPRVAESRVPTPTRALALALAVAISVAAPVRSQETAPKAAESGKPFKPEQIEQIVAPIALYPDDLVSQILMASTYPLEVVQASRWLEANKNLKGDALAKALEAQSFDASVKSLVGFPQVLAMMNEKLDWMQRLGNVFLAQQKEVMDAIQKLRKKAQEEGHLESSKEQTVTTEGGDIVIEPADPEVIYVPTYNPTIVYGSWPYPAYPPYYYYPPGYSGVGFGFAAGITLGFFWGYAWGGCHWGHGEVDIDIDRNVNRNREIDRGKYAKQMESRGTRGGKGSWQHDPSHRQGVGYADRATAKRFDRGPSAGTASREAFRGRTATPSPSTGAARQPAARPSATPERKSSSGSAFSGYDNGSSVKRQSSRGNASRSSYRSGGASRGARGGRR